MKNKIRNLAISILAAGTMVISSTAVNASYSYHKPETNGIEHKIDKEYGKPVKIRVIEISGKDSLGTVEDRAREITYENGTIVTYHGNYDGKKTVEIMIDGKKITERMEMYKNKWKIHDREVEYVKDGVKIEEWLSPLYGEELVIRHTKLEKPTKDGKVIEWYRGDDYQKGKKPDSVDYITETIIYPKGTKESDSDDYFYNQNEGLEGKRFFTQKSYWRIERKLEEEKNSSGEVVRRTFETILTDWDGKKTEKRIEQDYEPFKRPIVDGKIDFRRSTQQTRDGIYDRIDYDGDGIADEEITKKITTIYLE